MIFDHGVNHILTATEIGLCRNGWYLVYAFCSEDSVDEARERVDWLFENNIPYKEIMREVQHEVINAVWRIWVKGEAGAMAFKLRWE